MNPRHTNLVKLVLVFTLFQALTIDTTEALSLSGTPPSLHFGNTRAVSGLKKRGGVPPQGYYDPRTNGGKMLTSVNNTFPPGLGEPLNAIISANSDPDVLNDREDKGGLRNYFLSFGFSSECLGQHLGNDQMADLGDGNGLQNETAVIRWNYGDPYVGACKETVQGGNHFRYWVQDGKGANSGAVFLAVSAEQSIQAGHDIIPNGYNFARDWLVANATSSPRIDTLGLQTPLPPDQITTSVASVPETTNATATATSSAASSSTSTTPVASVKPLPTITGQTSFNGYTYTTTVTYVAGLLTNTSDGINHYITVEYKGRPAQDGLVAILEVHIATRPSNDQKSGANTLHSFPAFALTLSVLMLSLIIIFA